MEDTYKLKELVLDNRFSELQNLSSREVNLMSILRVEHKELQHSNMLAWLLSPNETHGLSDYFLKEFIRIYFRENEFKDLGNNENGLSVFEFVTSNYDDLVIYREHQNIDLLVLSKQNSLCIVIENKIYSGEGKGQLTKYRKIVSNELGEFRDYKKKIFIYLSLFEQAISEDETNYYIQITYEHIKALLENILINQSLALTDNVKFVIEQYLLTLRNLMNDDKELEQTAKKLYEEYRGAFDLVFKYAKPKHPRYVPNNLEELVKSRNDVLTPFDGNNGYVRFQPKFIHDLEDELKYNGFLNSETDIKQCWLYLFEFNITQNSINFDMKIGKYENSEIRVKLYDLYKQNKGLFNKVDRKLSKEWHLSLQHKVLNKDQRKSFTEEQVEEAITKEFNHIVDTIMPKIEDFFRNVLLKNKSVVQLVE